MEMEMNIGNQLARARSIIDSIEKDPDFAVDLYQDLWLSCLRQRGVDWSVPQERRIICIAKRLQINRFRRAAIRRHRPIDLVAPDEFAASEVNEQVEKEDLENLFSKLSELPSNYRRAIEQKYRFEIADGPLACEMNVTVATIRKWRSRGIELLRVWLHVHERPIKRLAGSVT